MAVFLGIGYALVGIVFAVPATHVPEWRLAAWGFSAIGYAAHIAYERFRLRNSPGSAALHVTFVALGAFGLAVGANIHSLASGSNHHRQLLLLALGIWPVITALPAFLVAQGGYRRDGYCIRGGPRRKFLAGEWPDDPSFRFLVHWALRREEPGSEIRGVPSYD